MIPQYLKEKISGAKIESGAQVLAVAIFGFVFIVGSTHIPYVDAIWGYFQIFRFPPSSEVDRSAILILLTLIISGIFGSTKSNNQ